MLTATTDSTDICPECVELGPTCHLLPVSAIHVSITSLIPNCTQSHQDLQYEQEPPGNSSPA